MGQVLCFSIPPKPLQIHPIDPNLANAKMICSNIATNLTAVGQLLACLGYDEHQDIDKICQLLYDFGREKCPNKSV